MEDFQWFLAVLGSTLGVVNFVWTWRSQQEHLNVILDPYCLGGMENDAVGQPHQTGPKTEVKLKCIIENRSHFGVGVAGIGLRFEGKGCRPDTVPLEKHNLDFIEARNCLIKTFTLDLSLLRAEIELGRTPKHVYVKTVTGSAYFSSQEQMHELNRILTEILSK